MFGPDFSAAILFFFCALDILSLQAGQAWAIEDSITTGTTQGTPDGIARRTSASRPTAPKRNKRRDDKGKSLFELYGLKNLEKPVDSHRDKRQSIIGNEGSSRGENVPSLETIATPQSNAASVFSVSGGDVYSRARAGPPDEPVMVFNKWAGKYGPHPEGLTNGQYVAIRKMRMREYALAYRQRMGYLKDTYHRALNARPEDPYVIFDRGLRRWIEHPDKITNAQFIAKRKAYMREYNRRRVRGQSLRTPGRPRKDASTESSSSGDTDRTHSAIGGILKETNPMHSGSASRTSSFMSLPDQPQASSDRSSQAESPGRGHLSSKGIEDVTDVDTSRPSRQGSLYSEGRTKQSRLAMQAPVGRQSSLPSHPHLVRSRSNLGESGSSKDAGIAWSPIHFEPQHAMHSPMWSDLNRFGDQDSLLANTPVTLGHEQLYSDRHGWSTHPELQHGLSSSSHLWTSMWPSYHTEDAAHGPKSGET